MNESLNKLARIFDREAVEADTRERADALGLDSSPGTLSASAAPAATPEKQPIKKVEISDGKQN
jgi:hypothetical protein